MGEMLLNGRLYGASGIRELTQAQYDALPASKLTDGILYCIKDTGIVEGDKYAPVIYSLEEREIGVWTDGKPLYQKTLIPTQLTSDLATEDFMISNIERIVRCSGRISNNANILCANVPFYINNDYRVGFETRVQDTSTVRCKSYFGVQSPSSYKITDITIQYTKTTDVPGSGTWGTDGVPMVHYDGNEKVIGTWFGETLYEKTIQKDIASIVGNSTIDITSDLNALNVSKVVKYQNVTDFTLISGSTYIMTYLSDDLVRFRKYNSAYELVLTVGSSTLTNVTIVFTIQYTKSL